MKANIVHFSITANILVLNQKIFNICTPFSPSNPHFWITPRDSISHRFHRLYSCYLRLLSRLSDAFPWVIRHSEGYANAPPSAKSTRAKALGIQPFRLDTPAADNRSTTWKVAHHRRSSANNHRLTQNKAQINTILWKSVPNSVKIRGKNHTAARPERLLIIAAVRQITTD